MNSVELISVEFEPYVLRAKSTVQVRTDKIELRHGYLVRCRFTTGVRDFVVTADLAPLAGLHQESIDEAHQGLKAHLKEWQSQKIPLIDLSTFKLSDMWTAFVSHALPSASWCLFQIAVVLHADAREQSIGALLSGQFTPRVVGSAHLGSNDSRAVVKLKVQSLEDLKSVDESAARGQLIRLDSNRTLDKDTALAIASHVKDYDIEFWEEPTELDYFEALRNEIDIPLALDETLWLDSMTKVAADVYVVKPTRLGFSETFRWIERAHSQDKPVIISSCYESEIGLDFLRAFASGVAPSQIAGLGVAHLFEPTSVA